VSTPDADALMAAVLADPADPLQRLVFADYLDDAGGSGNTAWAEYIRLRTAAAGEESALRRELLRNAAADIAPQITGWLAVTAVKFLADVPSFLDLLPANRITVRLDDFTPLRQPHGPDPCRAHRGIPLGPGGGQLVVGVIPEATVLDHAYWRHQHRPAILVRIPTADLEPALQRAYTSRALALAMPQVVTEAVPTTLDEEYKAASAEVVRGFVEQLVAQARERGAAVIDITAYADHHWVRRLEHGRSVRWHRVGTALGRELVRAARVLPARRLNVRVRRRNTSFGDGVRIHILSGQRPADGGQPEPARPR
jgi:uncharacterized protein (TIGR02996 family)